MLDTGLDDITLVTKPRRRQAQFIAQLGQMDAPGRSRHQKVLDHLATAEATTCAPILWTSSGLHAEDATIITATALELYAVVSKAQRQPGAASRRAANVRFRRETAPERGCEQPGNRPVC